MVKTLRMSLTQSVLPWATDSWEEVKQENWERSKRAIIHLKNFDFHELDKDSEFKVVIYWLKCKCWTTLWNTDRHEFSLMIIRDFYANLRMELNGHISSIHSHMSGFHVN